MRVFVVALWMVFTITLMHYAQAQTRCNTEFVEALKTRFESVTSSALGEALYQAACVDKGSKNKRGIRYKGLQLGDGKTTVHSACEMEDYSFFSENDSELVGSFLPAEAFPLLAHCFPTEGGLQLQVSRSGKTATVTASWSDSYAAGLQAKMMADLDFSGPVSCPGTNLKEDTLLMPGGVTESCEITADNGYMTFVINTTRGTRVANLKTGGTPHFVFEEVAAENPRRYALFEHGRQERGWHRTGRRFCADLISKPGSLGVSEVAADSPRRYAYWSNFDRLDKSGWNPAGRKFYVPPPGTATAVVAAREMKAENPRRYAYFERGQEETNWFESPPGGAIHFYKCIGDQSDN